MSWDTPASCMVLLLEGYKFGGEEMVMVCEKCSAMTIFWVVWMDRNVRIFERAVDEEVDHLWDRIRFGISFGLCLQSYTDSFVLVSFL